MMRRTTATLLAAMALVAGCADAVGTDTDLPLIAALCDPMPCGTSPNLTQYNMIDQAIDDVDADGCNEMANTLRDMFNDGRMLVYSTDDGNWADAHWGGGDPDEIHVWSGTFNEPQQHVTNILRHEYGHLDARSTSEGQADDYVTSCDGSGN